ncbi:MAG: PIN domain-containing protein [Chloroflexota bacterium]|nr:MAG: PIN domain-containing protein [Chloroflexota bacterium]
MRVPQSILERRVFIDTSAFLAIVDEEISKRCVSEKYGFLTTRFVVVETHAGLLGAVGTDEARAFIESGLEEITEVPIEESDYQYAKRLILEYRDKDYSLCDAISFAVVQRLSVSLAFAFDSHFRQHGFFTPLDQPQWP